MYKELATKITNNLLKNNKILKEDAEIYIYSFQIILSTIVSSLFIILWAILFKQILSTFIFFLGFFLCRTFSGGYHAQSQIGCFLLTQVIFILYLFIVSFSDITESRILLILITIFTTINVLIFAPVDSENKPFSADEKIKFKRKSRFFMLINILIVNISIFFPVFFQFVFYYMLGIFAVSMMLIFGKFKNITLLKKISNY